MVRSRRKKVTKPISGVEEDNFDRNRRSSMKVNLSFVSDLSNSIHESLKKTNEESDKNNSINSFVENDDLLKSLSTNKSTKSCVNNDTTMLVSNISVINLDDCSNNKSLSKNTKKNSLIVIKEKEQQLNKSCMQLKDAIMYKTQKLFDKENELAIKTTAVLTARCSTNFDNLNENSEIDKRSPSIKVHIGKNDQIVMAGDGNKKNPVRINSMSNNDSKEINHKSSSQSSDETHVDCNQSIVSTPKKLRVQNKSDEKEACSRAPETTLRIPVIRLFADNNDPNNSMSELNLVTNVNSHKRIDIKSQQENINIINERSNVSNELNYSTSPILSQGTRRSRISCLSLKRKLKKGYIQTSSKHLHNTINESFISRIPLTCSSLIEKQANETNVSQVSKNSKSNNSSKGDVNNHSKTINLEDSQKNNTTIHIDSCTNQLSMELTAISSHAPIKYRSFQKSIRKSLKFDNRDISQEEIKNMNVIEENERETNDSNAKTDSKLNNQVSNNPDFQNNYITDSANSPPNQDVLDTNLINCIPQKENKRPNIIEVISNTDKIKEIIDNNALVSQYSSSCSIRSSMQVNTSLDPLRKSIIGQIIPDEKCPSDKSISQQPNLDANNKQCDNRIMRLSRSSIHKVKKNSMKIISQQPTSNTIRSSLEVNTSLDSARKSPVAEKLLNFSNMLSMVGENVTNHDKKKTCNHSLTSHSSDSENDLENISLIKRIKNISSIKQNQKLNQVHQSTVNKINKSNGVECPKFTPINKTVEIENNNVNSIEECDLITENKLTPKRKSSIVEGTPYPVSRSVLFKTMLKNKIPMNTVDLTKSIDMSDNNDLSNRSKSSIPTKKKAVSLEQYQSINARKKMQAALMDTIVLNSSDELSSKLNKEKEPVIIDESLNDTDNTIKSNKVINNKRGNKKILAKRKLYPVRQNSQLISFSPADIQDSPKDTRQTENKIKRKRKIMPQRKQTKEKTGDDIVFNKEDELLEEEILENIKKPKKKSRKIISKKIVIKKVTNISILERLMNNGESRSQRISTRSSSKEFDFRSVRSHQKENKSKKNIIVVTGLTKEEKDLVKSVIKSLGSATLELNVTPRTTHVISAGLRTINLLKGIIRGCWLLSLDWALKSLESGKWLDPSPYEMCHFAKAVQENRRDRKLFGKAYTPEIFVTCGLIYIQNGTSPSAAVLKDLIKIAGGRITDNPEKAAIIIGKEGLKEIWVLDSITTGEVQPLNEYKRTK